MFIAWCITLWGVLLKPKPGELIANPILRILLWLWYLYCTRKQHTKSLFSVNKIIIKSQNSFAAFPWRWYCSLMAEQTIEKRTQGIAYRSPWGYPSTSPRQYSLILAGLNQGSSWLPIWRGPILSPFGNSKELSHETTNCQIHNKNFPSQCELPWRYWCRCAKTQLEFSTDNTKGVG